MYLNANIPLIECYVRGNYLRDQQDSHDKYFWCVEDQPKWTTTETEVGQYNYEYKDTEK
jgi:hypothetical protein